MSPDVQDHPKSYISGAEIDFSWNPEIRFSASKLPFWHGKPSFSENFSREFALVRE